MNSTGTALSASGVETVYAANKLTATKIQRRLIDEVFILSIVNYATASVYFLSLEFCLTNVRSGEFLARLFALNVAGIGPRLSVEIVDFDFSTHGQIYEWLLLGVSTELCVLADVEQMLFASAVDKVDCIVAQIDGFNLARNSYWFSRLKRSGGFDTTVDPASSAIEFSVDRVMLSNWDTKRWVIRTGKVVDG